MGRILCVGHGKLGTIVSALLAKANMDVCVVDVNEAAAPVVYPTIEVAPTAETLIFTLPNYTTVEAVLAAAPAEKLAGKTVLVLSSLTIDQSIALEGLVKGKGAALVVGQVESFRGALGTDDAYVCYAGDEAAYKAVEPIVKTLGGNHYMGENIMAASLMDFTANGVHYSYVLAFYTGVAMCRKYGLPMNTYLHHTLKSLYPLAEAAKRNIFKGLDDPRTFEEIDDVIHGMEMLVCLLKKSGAKEEVRYNNERLLKIQKALDKHWNDIMEVYATQA